MITKIEIHECGGDYRIWASAHRTDDKDEAVGRAVSKAFGKRAWLWEDNGLTTNRDAHRYGQVGVPCSAGGTDLITGRVHVRIQGEAR